MIAFLLVVQAIIAAMLIGVILVQKSEGGGLGMGGGGSPAGLMSARGAADFLTRSTTILATIFVALCIVLAVLATQRNAGKIDTSAVRNAAPAQAPQTPAAPVPMADPNAAPVTGAAPAAPIPAAPIPVAPTGTAKAPTPARAAEPRAGSERAPERVTPPSVVPTQTVPSTAPAPGTATQGPPAPPSN